MKQTDLTWDKYNFHNKDFLLSILSKRSFWLNCVHSIYTKRRFCANPTHRI